MVSVCSGRVPCRIASRCYASLDLGRTPEARKSASLRPLRWTRESRAVCALAHTAFISIPYSGAIARAASASAAAAAAAYAVDTYPYCRELPGLPNDFIRTIFLKGTKFSRPRITNSLTRSKDPVE